MGCLTHNSMLWRYFNDMNLVWFRLWFWCLKQQKSGFSNQIVLDFNMKLTKKWTFTNQHLFHITSIYNKIYHSKNNTLILLARTESSHIHVIKIELPHDTVSKQYNISHQVLQTPQLMSRYSRWPRLYSILTARTTRILIPIGWWIDICNGVTW